MISIIHITSRAANCLTYHPESTQYDVLAQSLRCQTHADWECIVVDQTNPLPRPELAVFGDRIQYTRPRETPWRKLGAFCAASARNAGLALARGDVVFGADDCMVYPPTLLAHTAAYAARGEYLVPRYDCEMDAAKTVPTGRPVAVTEAGGVLAYPRDIAVALGGHEERFDGCEAFDDFEFSARLSRHGARFVADPRIAVTLLKHTPRNGRGVLRCCHAVRHAVRDSRMANEPWTSGQLAAFTSPTCPHMNRGACLLSREACRYPDWRPSPATVEIMTTYEAAPWMS